MAVLLTGTGGVFQRLGDYVTELNRVVSGYGSALDSGVEEIFDQYPNATEEASAIAGLLPARDSYRGVHGSYTSALVTAARNTVIEQVNRDTPLPQKTFPAAITELKNQMVDSGDSINKPTLTATVTPWASNKGNAVINVSVINTLGNQTDMAFAEDIKFTVSSDVSSGGTQFAETLTIAGEPLLSATNYNWPGGSGASGTMRIVDASNNGLITDGGFETWVGAVPTYWTATTGAATVDKNTNATYLVRGTYSLKITSDGSTLTTIRQQLSSAVAPNTVYALNLWAAMSAADASGAVRFRLTDSGGTVLTNDAGDSLTYSRDTNGQIGTSLTQVTTFFQTGRQLPTSGGVWLEIGFTTAPASPKVLYLDHLGFVSATQLYAGGPFVAAFSKSTSNANGDYYTLAVTNNLGTRSFVRSLDRWLDLRTNRLYIPTASSETVSDTLIS